MTLDEFWDHVRLSKRKDPDAHAERLEARLAKLKPEEIIDFVHWWDTMIREAYDWNLWGAAYMINGGCSDDGFHYFCSWLLLKGRDVFQAALTDPDTLADVVDPDDGEVEWDGTPGTDSWLKATKRKPTDKGYEALNAALLARHGPTPMMPDLGAMWDHDDDEQMRKRFPRLAALYLDADGAD